MTWEKLNPILSEEAGYRSNCGTCGPQPLTFPREGVIAAGFGDAGVTRDGETVWSEAADADAEFWTGEDAEKIAKSNPDHDWRIYIHGPLSDVEYQRQGDGWWVLIKKGQGFA